jgi:hypothetical protein
MVSFMVFTSVRNISDTPSYELNASCDFCRKIKHIPVHNKYMKLPQLTQQ